MFTFGFSSGDEKLQDRSNSNVSNSLKWQPAAEITPNTETVKLSNEMPCSFEMRTCNILYSNPSSALQQQLSKGDIAKAEQQHSDLIPATYEGGFKVWECTYDLATYLETEIERGNIDFSGKTVLDLGCGHGLLGIFALLNGATVHFQDYNSSVLTSVTVQNVILNFSNEEWKEKLARCRFFSGDWSSFVELTENEGIKYDFILSSETIYNPHNYDKLFSVIKNRLLYGGSVYLAAKVYYFGVGGGIRQFEKLLNAGGTMSFQTCWKCCEGVNREILKITFKEVYDS